MKRITFEEFLKRARKKHGDKFDYTRADYIGYDDPIEVGCPSHGFFSYSPRQHLRSYGCPKCGIDARRSARAKDPTTFVEQAQEMHGDFFDYSKVRYVNSKKPVTIVCPMHGPWQSIPSNHLRGAGCPACYGRNKTTESYIDEARSAHGDKYDYSLVQYVDARTPVTIICPKHGPWSQKAVSHISGKGCPQCGYEDSAEKRRITTAEFIKEAKAIHGDTYDYSQTEYKGKKEKLKIVCPKHGVFEQTAEHHKIGSGCRKCFDERLGDLSRLSTEEFVERAKVVHGEAYDYSLVNYLNSAEKVKIICPIHGVFEQSPGNHTNQGQGCPKCRKTGFNQSKPGTFYYIRIETRNQTLYKVGVTNLSVQKRFPGKDQDLITVLYLETFESGADALDLETECLRRYRDYRYHGAPVLRQVGTTEMFTCDILGFDRQENIGGQ